MNQRLKLTSLIWAIVAASCLAQVETVTVKRGEIHAVTSELDGDTRWIVYHPLDLKFITAFDEDLRPILAFTPPATAKKAVIEADCVNWEDKKRSSKRWVFVFEGDEPKPPKPDPDEPDEPDPDNPDPIDVPDGYLGLTKFAASLKIPSDHLRLAQDIADNFRDAAEGLAPGDAVKEAKYNPKTAQIWLSDANRKVLSSRESFDAWKPHIQAIDKRMETHWQTMNKYILADAWRAIADGLELNR